MKAEELTTVDFTQKVRRPAVGGERAPGWAWQERRKQARRADPSRLMVGKPDASLSSVGGLVSFGAWCRAEGIDEQLERQFGHLKTGSSVVYPMGSILRLLIDASVVGIPRVFGLEALAADPLLVHLQGGAFPSTDTIYRDLQRFEAQDAQRLERIVSRYGLAPAVQAKLKQVTLDIDPTVMGLFGEQQYAFVGYNPKYHGRPSYFPLVARIAETDTVLGARLRPGNSALGEADVEDIEAWLDQTREALPDALITVRIDRGGDAKALFDAIDAKGAMFVIKMRQSLSLLQAAALHTDWETIDEDADGEPIAQVAELDFQRSDWTPGKYRVIALRDKRRKQQRQVPLWPGMDDSICFYVTNDHFRTIEDIALLYDDRAGIETLIRELKDSFGAGKMPSFSFDANETAMLIKLLAHNLLRCWVLSHLPKQVHRWHADWIRWIAIRIPARLLHSGRRWIVRLAPRPMLN